MREALLYHTRNLIANLITKYSVLQPAGIAVGNPACKTGKGQGVLKDAALTQPNPAERMPPKWNARMSRLNSFGRKISKRIVQ